MSNQRGRPANDETQQMIDRIEAMRIGHSFFIEGVQSSDLQFLRRPARIRGVGIAIKHVAVDEIYQVPGVRVWRQEGACDEI
jgi:hypothetical protein